MATQKDVFKRTFQVLEKKVVVKDLSSIGKPTECSFSMKRFAYPANPSDSIKNDTEYPLYPLSNAQINPELYLEKKEDCEWVELEQLDSNSLLGNTFDDSSRPFWIGFELKWKNVYDNYDVGCYRLRLEYSDLISGDREIEFSYQYELAVFNENLADGTIKFEYTISGGKRGYELDDEVVVDYGDISWKRELRINGIFGYSDVQEYESEYIRYKNGATVWTKDKSIEKYDCILKKLPHSLHVEIKKVVLHADKILVTDYNLVNTAKYEQKRVLRDSNYEPTYDKNTSYSSVQLKFKQYYDNTINKRC